MTTFDTGTLDDMSVSDVISVDLENMKAILGVKSRASIYRSIDSGDIPPPARTRPLEWTIGQLRDWRLRKSLAANERAWSLRTKMRERKPSTLEDVLASV